MKKILLLLIILGLVSCKDRQPDPNVLPESTQTGANTAGALVDGKVWVATTKPINTMGGLGTRAGKINNITYFQIDLRNIDGISRILIKSAVDDFKLNEKYVLTETPDTSDYNYAIYQKDNSNGYSTKPHSEFYGSVKITRLDLQNEIIAGTFEFKAVDKSGNVVNVTEGRFDKKFD